jgi:hypothetical protein
MKETDLDHLCVGATPDEIRHIYKMVNEWGNGDPNSFPVQLALLTKAQWRAAAQMPLLLQKNIVAFEAKLADQQKQIAALMKILSSAGDAKIKAFEDTVAIHTEAMEKVGAKSYDHLDETENFAREIRGQMERGLRESEKIKNSLIDERHRLEAAKRRYEIQMEWRDWLALFMSFMAIMCIGIALGVRIGLKWH